MLAMSATMFAGLAGGAVIGHKLAARGVTADNALRGRQALAYVVIGALGGAFALLYWSHALPFLPDALVVLGEASLWPLVQFITAAALGLFFFLEWPGRRDRKRALTLTLASALLLGANTYLAYRSMPLTGRLGPHRLSDGVVIQSTPYTCGPASIATLLRALGDTTATEQHIVSLAGATRGGMTSFGELRALRKLGLTAAFARSLTPESLLARRSIAVLHVDEPIGSTTIRHAVALLSVDPVTHTVTLGNPLYGRQVKPLSELRGYWTGEAIFVQR